MPPSLADRSAREGDERLTALASRRSTLDWVLQRAAAGQAGVTLRGGVRVRGLTAAPGTPPRVTAALFGGDNGTMQLAVAPLAADRRFRAVKNPGVFTAVLRTIPAYAAWLDVMDPISPVFPMGGLHNTLRRLVTDGAPVVTGLHAIGDSVCTTNPTFGRGLSLALSGACDLVDTLGKHPDDPIAQALVLDEHLDDHVAPYYQDQATIDSARLAMLRHVIFGAPSPAPPPEPRDRVTYAQLRTAAASDPVAFRAFWKSTERSAAPTRSTPTRMSSRPPVRRLATRTADRPWLNRAANSCWRRWPAHDPKSVTPPCGSQPRLAAS